MKRIYHLIASWFVAFAMAACATMGAPAPTDFNGKVVAASKTVDAVAASAIQMRVAGKLSDTQRDKAVEACTKALNAIEAAKKLRGVDLPSAENRLALALTVITALQAFTANPNSSQAALDAALAALAVGAKS